jgi:hypothetical protein
MARGENYWEAKLIDERRSPKERLVRGWSQAKSAPVSIGSRVKKLLLLALFSAYRLLFPVAGDASQDEIIEFSAPDLVKTREEMGDDDGREDVF